MTRYGIIDLGSNTIRLCIYDVNCSSRSPLQKKDIQTLLNYKVMAGLASHVKDGIMSERGIKKAIKTINEHLEHASHFSCSRIDIFATAVLRNCNNSIQATSAIETGIDKRITLLSNEEEAHLGYLGACLDTTICNGTMIDIGGGSTELTRIEDGFDLNKVSLAQGSLSSFAHHVKGVLPHQEEMDAIAKAFRDLWNAHIADEYASSQLYGIGGAIRSAAKVYGDLCNKGDRLDYLIPEHIEMLLQRYITNPDVFAHEALRTIPDRIHTFIPGCILIQELFILCKAQRLDICKFGIREGYLAERILVRPIANPKAPNQSRS